MFTLKKVPQISAALEATSAGTSFQALDEHVGQWKSTQCARPVFFEGEHVGQSIFSLGPGCAVSGTLRLEDRALQRLIDAGVVTNVVFAIESDSVREVQDASGFTRKMFDNCEPSEVHLVAPPKGSFHEVARVVGLDNAQRLLAAGA